MSVRYVTNSEEETQKLGEQLAQQLTPGSVIAFTGDLGAGKTAFTRGLPLFHFDMYRLDSSEELYEIGWEDYLARGGVCAVEWSENIEDALEHDTIRVDIRRGEHEGQRLIEIGGIAL